MFGLGDHLADLRLLSVRGYPGLGVFRLACEVQMSFRARLPGNFVEILDLAGELSIGPPGGACVYAGRAAPLERHSVVSVREFGFNRTVYLTVDLSRDRVDAIERVRGGGGLTFRLDVSALALNGTQYGTPTDSINCDINQGVWIDTLRAMGYAQHMLLEVPVFPREVSPEMTQAAEYLQEMSVAFARGHWRGVVATARAVMEAIDGALGDRDTAFPEAENMFVGARSLDRAGRIRLLRRALRTFAAPAHHGDHDASRIEWSRADAMMAMSIAVALFSRLASGKAEPP